MPGEEKICLLRIGQREGCEPAAVIYSGCRLPYDTTIWCPHALTSILPYIHFVHPHTPTHPPSHIHSSTQTTHRHTNIQASVYTYACLPPTCTYSSSCICQHTHTHKTCPPTSVTHTKLLWKAYYSVIKIINNSTLQCEKNQNLYYEKFIGKNLMLFLCEMEKNYWMKLISSYFSYFSSCPLNIEISLCS